MKPLYKYAGLAGIFTGIALLLELIFFMASGFSPDKLGDPTKALALVQDKELLLRIATFFGFVGAIVRVIYVAGLAAKLQAKTQTRATAVLYFGILGSVGHGLVALSFYLGLPTLVALATTHLPAAVGSWGAFLAITNGFQGLGNLLLGLMLALAGSAIISKGELPKGLGWVGIIAGIASIVGVVTTATPLGILGFALYLPSVALAIVFDIWAGRSLVRLEG
ncbi:MAG TPA: DUF4386 family protein [Patescibacteria group bacterium]|nr:DUF4386 family protein [Patescibacteria group bacterium]